VFRRGGQVERFGREGAMPVVAAGCESTHHGRGRRERCVPVDVPGPVAPQDCHGLTQRGWGEHVREQKPLLEGAVLDEVVSQ
jgi:hypothetical protein